MCSSDLGAKNVKSFALKTHEGLRPSTLRAFKKARAKLLIFLEQCRISLVNSSTAVKSLSRQCRGFACKTDSASRGRRLATSSETFNFLGAVQNFIGKFFDRGKKLISPMSRFCLQNRFCVSGAAARR